MYRTMRRILFDKNFLAGMTLQKECISPTDKWECGENYSNRHISLRHVKQKLKQEEEQKIARPGTFHSRCSTSLAVKRFEQ